MMGKSPTEHIEPLFGRKLHRIHVWYGIFTYIWPEFMVNVGKYSIHGADGNMFGICSNHLSFRRNLSQRVNVTAEFSWEHILGGYKKT